jgi:hypothetical protein
MIIDTFTNPKATGITYSFFRIIPRLISEAHKDEAPILLACNAVGYAYLANKARLPIAARHRAHAYSTALSAINQALCDPVQYKSDSTFLAVWLLSLYEVTLLLYLRIGSSLMVFHTRFYWELRMRQ